MFISFQYKYFLLQVNIRNTMMIFNLDGDSKRVGK